MAQSLLGRLIGRAMKGVETPPDQDKIRAGILGALGPCVELLDAGASVELRWLVAKGGRVGCRVVLRDASGKPHVTLFSGEGKEKHGAAAVVFTMVASSVGFSEGSAWKASADRLLEGVTERLRGEGLL